LSIEPTSNGSLVDWEGEGVLDFQNTIKIQPKQNT
jgi:hypothetical protein